MQTSAYISEDGVYRYWLRRVWDDTLPECCWIMLNPSTADATVDDPTIRRCVGFAKKWGYGSIIVVNLFAFRATEPEALKAAADPIGPECDAFILSAARAALLTICGWGNHGMLGGRVRAVRSMLKLHGISINHLGLTKSSQPKHPLYLSAATRPIPFPH